MSKKNNNKTASVAEVKKEAATPEVTAPVTEVKTEAATPEVTAAVAEVKASKPDKKGGEGVTDADLQALQNKAVELTKEDKLKAAAKEALGYFPTETDCYVTEDGNVFLSREKDAARFHAQQKKQQLYLFHKESGVLTQQ